MCTYCTYTVHVTAYMDLYPVLLLPQAKPPDYEYSEMVLYEVQLLQEAGMKGEALKHIKSFESNISDPLSVMETRGMLVPFIIGSFLLYK